MKQFLICNLLFIFMNGCTLLTDRNQSRLSPIYNTESNNNFEMNAKHLSDNDSYVTVNDSYWGPVAGYPYDNFITPYPPYYYDPYMTGYYGYFPYGYYYDPVYYYYGYPYYYYDDFEDYLKEFHKKKKLKNIIRERFQHRRKARQERFKNISNGFKDRRQARRDFWRKKVNSRMDHPFREPFRQNIFRNWGRRR